ncbi:hypothetical protein [Actinomadura rugatobispora]|uniref:Uncharacterized protein n=1 Tax=Actinomadura rugatobispora TaxID=1994 RepID=A0ABW0ZQ29_9ACTN|nr:hypothetical protein GCM10010200_024780 [Actinomadura rugatobispora]
MSRTTDDDPPDDLEALRRRAADAAASGRDDERVRALADLAGALWRSSPDDDLQARRPYLDEAIEALATARQVQATTDPAPGAAWSAEVTFRLAALLTLRNMADGDPTEQNTILALLREVVSGEALPADRAETARLLLGIVLVQGILLPFRAAGPADLLKIAMHVVATGPQDFQEAVELLGRVEEERLPENIKPLPLLLKLLLMYCRALSEGRAGRINLFQIATLMKTARSFFDELSGGRDAPPMLRRMADDMRAGAGEAIEVLEEARETPSASARS